MSLPKETIEHWLAVGFVVIAIVFNLVFLFSEVALPVPPLNDNGLHYPLVARANEALSAKESIFDHWVSYWVMGFPVFHYYQHLPHIFVAALHRALGQRVDLLTLFNWVKYLILAFFPLFVYFGLRKFEFPKMAAALSALCASLLSTNFLYGFDYGSFLWRGSGMYTQLWGMALLPLCLGQVYSTIKHGQGYFKSVALVAAILLSHVVYGYMAVLSALAFLFLRIRPAQSGQKIVRLALILAFSGLVISYFLIPYFANKAYLNRSVWEAQEKYDSYGHEAVMEKLFNGDLLDFGRLPMLTLLMFLGLARALTQKEDHHRIILLLFFLWLILYFGRPTWGILLNLLPLGSYLHLHRFIGGVHMAAIALIGIGLHALWQTLTAKPTTKVTGFVPALLVIIVLLIPVYRERVAYLGYNDALLKKNHNAFNQEAAHIQELVTYLRRLQQEAPARVYAGLAGNWGSKFTIGDVPLYALLSMERLDALSYLYHAMSLNADIQVYFNENDPAHYDLFNVGYVVAPVGKTFPEFVTPLKTIGSWVVYQVKTHGYFDLVQSDIAFYGPVASSYGVNYRWLNSNLLQAKQHPSFFLQKNAEPYREWIKLGEELTLPDVKGFAEADTGQIISQGAENQTHRASVIINQPGYLLFKMTYHPYWHVLVDGTDREGIMLSPSFVGVRLEPGMHQVQLQYRPPYYKSLLLVLGLITLMGILVFEKRLIRASDSLRVVDRVVDKVSAYVQKNTPRLFPYAVLFLIALVAGLALFQGKMPSGHDAMEYPPRSAVFYKGLTEGAFLPRWTQDLAAGYGEPFFNFNAPLYYYVVSALQLFGFGLINASNLACFIFLLASGLTMYILVSEFFGRTAGLVAAAAYMYAPYTLTDLYVRAAYSEFSAFPFPPLIFWAFYKLVETAKLKYLAIGSVAYALLMLGNNPISLIFTISLALFLLGVAWRTRSYAALLYGFLGVALGLMLSAFFWLPSLLEKDLIQTSKLLQGYLNYGNHFVYLRQLIYSPWGYGVSVAGPEDGMSFQIGPVYLAMVLLSVWVLFKVRRSRAEQRFWIKFFLAVVGLAVFFTTDLSRFVWDRVHLLQYMEFPWRFLILMAIATSFLCAVPFLFIRERQDLSRALAYGLIAAIFLSGYGHAKPEKFLNVTDSYFSPQNITAQRLEVTTAGEYRPKWAQVDPPAPATSIVSVLKGTAQCKVKRGLSLFGRGQRIYVNAQEDSVLRLNIHYFPGWKVLIDGQEAVVDFSNPYGLMDVTVSKGHSYIEVEFTNTPVRTVGNTLSVIGLMITLACLAYSWRADSSDRSSKPSPKRT